MIQIAVINQTTNLKDADVLVVVNALQIQLDRDFSPAYGYSAQLNFIYKDQPMPGAQSNFIVLKDSSTVDKMSQIILLDNSDDAGALGYHDLTKDGYPLGKVFVETTKKQGDSWSVTLSHELLEMMADPTINLSVQVGDDFIAYEIGDPVERDEDGYEINGIKVSNFVLPAYFEPVSPERTKFDFCGRLKAPAPVQLDGGYLSIYKIGSGWTEVYANKSQMRYNDKATLGSRRSKRRTPREYWMRSER